MLLPEVCSCSFYLYFLKEESDAGFDTGHAMFCSGTNFISKDRRAQNTWLNKQSRLLH